jgi:hypothetical protein
VVVRRQGKHGMTKLSEPGDVTLTESRRILKAAR